MLLRIGNMRGVDLSVFDFDYDLSWHAVLLGADGNVLGRFGGRDADTPAKYQTLAGLKHSLAAALQLHKAQQNGNDNTPPRKQSFAESYSAASKRTETACIHCHHVNEFRRDQMQREGGWSLDDVWVYPRPENLGLTLDAEQGDRVVSVLANSPAGKVGLKAKDVLRRIGKVPIASVADAQYALQQAPKKGELAIVWQNGEREKRGIIVLQDGWRKTDVSWRWSLKSLSPNPSIIGEDLDLEGRKRLGLKPEQLAYRHMNFLTPTARHAGLLANDVIVGIDDQMLTMNARQFETHVRLYCKVGQEITLNVLRGNERVKVKLKLPE